jgi:tRNA threonylcarbamoyl adenosine modification protein YeaZ
MGDAELVLAVDSSVRADGLVVLADPTGRVVASRSGLADVTGLLGAIRAILDLPGARIGRVLVARGPGSYIGVRTGLAAALGVAQGRQLPVLVVGTMEVVAARTNPEPGHLLVLAAAGRGGVYGQQFEPLPVQGHWRRVAPTVVVGARADWPSAWSESTLLLDPDRVAGPERTWLEPIQVVRSRVEALGLLTQRGTDARSGYDHVTADYGTRLGEPSWS